MKIGVLALQGSFAEHGAVLRHLGVEVAPVRLPRDLDGLDGLILPGGESTTMGKLASTYGLIEPMRSFGQERPVWGTCAGTILLARDAHREQPLLELLDVSVVRNAFGRQVDSFETQILFPSLADPERPFRSVFIRAPMIARVGGEGEVLGRLPQTGKEAASIIAVRQGHLLATCFHPELTDDDRFHRAFLDLVEQGRS